MNIVVLTGGASDERSVALASGAQIADALRQAGHHVVAVDTVCGPLTSDEERRLLEGGVGDVPERLAEAAGHGEERTLSVVTDSGLGSVDVVFLALHGGAGEDGTTQTLLESVGLAHTGTGPLGCALAMDKDVTKRLLRDADIPTPDWLTGEPSIDEVEERLGLPVVVKASGGGSSLRLVVAHDRDELASAIEESRSWNDRVVYEAWVRGREFTVGILGQETLPVGEIVPEHEFFDYACKYEPGLAREIFPAEIDGALARQLQTLAHGVHEVLRLRDVSRVDFIVDEEGRPWCLEANALPGMTGNSLLPKSARAAGISFPELCDRIARLARNRSATHSGTGEGDQEPA